jgi:aspartate-semialdehyde dehydrogenase
MTRVALLNPTSLLGKELVEQLEAGPGPGRDLALLSLDEEEIGALTEAAGAAALVRRAEPAEIAAADVVVVCGGGDAYAELLGHRRTDATVIVADPAAAPTAGVPVVAGINLEAATAGRVLVSPHPGTVLLAHLLAPLLPLALREVVATLVQPASLFGRPGLDELYEQARRLVALQGQEPSELFGRQLAFNLYPARRPPAHLAAQARAVLGDGAADLRLAVHLLQGAVFHGVSALLHLHPGEGIGPEALRERLAGHPLVELSEPPEGEDEDLLGPIDAVAHDKVLVGPVERDPDGGLWVWAVMDNLTRGGALNVMAILERAAGAGAVH